jgi:hypothetical protein
MKTFIFLPTINILILSAGIAGFSPARVFAHCDTLDGPVVKAAQQALEERNVDLALIWVQKGDEIEIRGAFEETLAVRVLTPQARKLADRHFFETLVRVHRAGEGAPFTGLKPAGSNLGPAVPLGDKALDARELEPVLHLLSSELRRGLHERFTAAVSKKKFAANDVEAGRDYVKAYVIYIHYVEALYRAATTAGHAHPEEIDEKHVSSLPSDRRH